nr:C10 family peptidase [candidate division Zixibacteria bacterium]
MLTSFFHKTRLFIRAALIMTLLTGTVFGTMATKEEMDLVCGNWLTHITMMQGDWAGAADPQRISEEEIRQDGMLLGRCFKFEPEGWAVIPVLKEMPPIMAYSDENGIDWNDADGVPVLLREVLANRIGMYIERYGSIEAAQMDRDEMMFGPEHGIEWARYLKSEKEFQDDLKGNKPAPMDELGPLLTTKWHQDYPYNQLCPYGDGGRTVVGCVATAAAQILAYHRWPPEGTGTHGYFWYGDNSCEGSSASQIITADYTDPYDWDNIVDQCTGGCTLDQINALTELCFEVGVAFNMDYGVCGSGAYTADVQQVFPDHFRYLNQIEKHDRYAYNLLNWSNLMQSEIEAGRPMQYRISSHSIVCDGWRMYGETHQVHMNYGWGGSNNYWYAIDDLYCNWDGCSPSVEYAMTNIVPDRGVYFSADTTWGQYPLEVEFFGESELTVDSWSWNFGDGGTSEVQSPKHLFTQPGRYDVTLQVNAGGEIRSYATTKYITVLADTMMAMSIKGDPGQSVEVVVNAANTVPLRGIKMPVQYSGLLGITYDSFNTIGCRTEYFDYAKRISLDPVNKTCMFSLYNIESTTADLEAGNGPILKIYFTIPAGSSLDQTTEVRFEGYSSYEPLFYGPILNYCPLLESATISLDYLCGDADFNEAVNILDVTYMVTYLYRSGPEPIPSAAGDVNGSGATNILDVTYMISYLYKNGPGPICP